MDTIYALSSGLPPAAIAIIRISGPAAGAALDAFAGACPEPRRATLVSLREAGELLDRAIALWFPGPETVTGEDLAELHLHGGRAVVGAVTRALSRLPGLRPAEPGEFTRRSFANGRIDLTEAEGIADLLAAETESQRRMALGLIGGALTRQVRDWSRRLLALAAVIEADLDFADEGDVEEGLPASWEDDRSRLEGEMARLLARPPAERLRDGVRIVISGPPNSGKSTLLNALVGRDAAITSEIAGTTRDLIEVPVAIQGVPFLFMDSAGIRASGDVVEAIGIERAEVAIAAADIVLWLGNPEEAPGRANVIQIQAKSDLVWTARPNAYPVSAKTSAGLEELIEHLIGVAEQLLPGESEVALNGRQRKSLGEALEHLRRARGQPDLLVAAEELRLVRRALDIITGTAGVEDMLDALFARFCIGK